MIIRKAKIKDLTRIAECHQRAFPKSLSSAMGITYLKKMLEWYLTDPRAFLFYVNENDSCLGYCGGLKYSGDNQVGSASSMIQYSFNAAIKSILFRPWLLVHPEFISKDKLALRNVWRRISSNRKPLIPNSIAPPSSVAFHAGLIMIGVDPAYQGKGFGTTLLQEFENRSKEMGFHKLVLTVKSENTKAIKSYLRNGWIIVSDDRKSLRMSKDV